MTPKAIFFDLDGTLLPMDQGKFTNGYFKYLAQELCPLGIEPQPLIDAVWAGTKAMVKNDGSTVNKTVFWDKFAEETGKDSAIFEPVATHFYSEGFHKGRQFTEPNPLAKRAVELAGGGGRRVALATNPIFPMVGQRTRLSWIGLTPEDFELVTCYETDRFCKPNPEYFLSVCRRMELDPADCLMVGNDENEDMFAATAAGLRGYLVTDCLLPSTEHPWGGERGSFADLLKMLESLPK
jgi:FMN phosphatase YigB (HAD superfamily)